MPDAAVTGFFGKIPAAGDFVTWNLPRVFTDRWDRWVSRDLKENPAEGPLDATVWRFALPGAIFGADPAAGAWCMSEDRAGRRYPFVVARIGPPPEPTDPWFDAVAALVEAAVARRARQAEIAGRLAGLPEPGPGQEAPPILFWGGDAWTVREFRFADIYDLADNALPALRRPNPDPERE